MRKIYNDAPTNWAVGYQDEGTPIASGIVDFHNKALYNLIIIITIVAYLVIARVWSNRSINWLRKRNHSTIIELIWTILPGVILVVIAIPSLKLLYSIDEVVRPAVTLKAIGSQWFWTYQINDLEGLDINFDSYTKTEDDLSLGELRLLDVDNRVVLPIETPIRVLVSSNDVIHSFGIPSLGVKIDAIPGRINHASIYLMRPSTYYGNCFELCGAGHERMSIVIDGVNTPSFLSWLSTFA